MAGIPAWCLSCGEQTESDHLIEGLGPGVEARGIFIEDAVIERGCPNCGGNLRLMQAEFDIRNGIIEVITATPWTLAKLAEFRGALRWAAENYSERPDSALDEIGKQSPEAESALRERRKKLTTDQMVSLITLLIGVVTLLLQGMQTAIAVMEYLEPDPVPGPQIIQIIQSDSQLQEELNDLREKLDQLAPASAPPDSAPLPGPALPGLAERPPAPPGIESP